MRPVERESTFANANLKKMMSKVDDATAI